MIIYPIKQVEAVREWLNANLHRGNDFMLSNWLDIVPLVSLASCEGHILGVTLVFLCLTKGEISGHEIVLLW